MAEKKRVRKTERQRFEAALRRGGMVDDCVAEALRCYDAGVKPIDTFAVSLDDAGAVVLPETVICGLWPDLMPGAPLRGDVIRHRSGVISMTLVPAPE